MFNKDSCQFLYRYKKRRRSLHLPKWGSRLPLSDKHKRPTPQKGCCPWSNDQQSANKPIQQTEACRKTAYLRERPPYSRLGKLSRFHLENKSKTLYFVLKITNKSEKNTFPSKFLAKTMPKTHFSKQKNTPTWNELP